MARLSLLILLLFGSHAALTLDEFDSEQEDQEALESFESCVLKLRWAVIDYLRSLSKEPQRADLAQIVELWLTDCKARLTALEGADLKSKAIWIKTLEQTEKDYRRITRKGS